MAAGQKRQQPEEKAELAPDHSAHGQLRVCWEVDVDQVVAGGQVQFAPCSRGKVDVPHLLEVAAKVAALALQEQIHPVAGKDLGDLAGTQVDNPPRPATAT